MCPDRIARDAALRQSSQMLASHLMRNSPPHIESVSRALAVLEAMIEDGGRTNVSNVARRLGLPIATVHRQVATLVAEGFLCPAGRGALVAGARLRTLLLRVDEKQIIATCAASILHGLASQLRCVVQLGTLENDMVTYRLKTGRGAGALFTRTDMQLEAYCSGIGKVLLAHLPEPEREAYLATGPFVPLTRKTIVDPDALRRELEQTRLQGFATDDGEVSENVSCLAVPIRSLSDAVPAAISVTRLTTSKASWDKHSVIALLQAAAAAITAQAFAPDTGRAPGRAPVQGS